MSSENVSWVILASMCQILFLLQTVALRCLVKYKVCLTWPFVVWHGYCMTVYTDFFLTFGHIKFWFLPTSLCFHPTCQNVRHQCYCLLLTPVPSHQNYTLCFDLTLSNLCFHLTNVNLIFQNKYSLCDKNILWLNIYYGYHSSYIGIRGSSCRDHSVSTLNQYRISQGKLNHVSCYLVPIPQSFYWLIIKFAKIIVVLSQ